MSGVAVLALVLRIVALVLPSVGTLPLVATLLAVIGLVTGMRLFLPRLTPADKLLISAAMLLPLAALVVELIRRFSDSASREDRVRA